MDGYGVQEDQAYQDNQGFQPEQGGQHEQGAQEEQVVAGKRRLGRGLSALLGGKSQEGERIVEGEEHFQASNSEDKNHIAVELIERNPSQPRKQFSELALNDLAQSIKMHGLLQPVLVRSHEGRYQLIAGERRWLAAKQAGLTSIPCRVLELSDQYVAEAALEENLKREDLNALEKGEAFKEMLEKFSLRVEDLATRMSMDRSTVTNLIRLLELSEPVKEELRNDRITNGHARALLAVTDHEAQVNICQQIINDKVSVRKTEKLVKDWQKQGDEGAEVIQFPGNEKQDKKQPPEMNNHIASLQEQLRQVLGSQVEIKLKTNDTGNIVIPFNSNEDFERILNIVRNAA
ncbi:putative chromosome-partitioning protein ParB [Polystyrenella longa]|uniref:Putative chromosome-partitioning protein ParB n=1 Tax=Polystyrenella longa TaxID=2528007 RepID=A0A518CGT0_9PLAN|nr:ParB/RepB/Spo0J family partition protein [Polystyrenella longa]QDU78435.1 putative chromosome-partitioning protein ParB [Polystyrenella longa]